MKSNFFFSFLSIVFIFVLLSLFRILEHGIQAKAWIAEAALFCLSFSVIYFCNMTWIEKLISFRNVKIKFFLNIMMLIPSLIFASLPKVIFLERGWKAYPEFGPELLTWFFSMFFLIFLKYSVLTSRFLREEEIKIQSKKESQMMAIKFYSLDSDSLLKELAGIEENLVQFLASGDELYQKEALQKMEQLAERYQNILLKEAALEKETSLLSLRDKKV